MRYVVTSAVPAGLDEEEFNSPKMFGLVLMPAGCVLLVWC